MMEFYTSEEGAEIIISDKTGHHVFAETDVEFITWMHNAITDNFTEANKELHEIYGKAPNFKFLKVRRFIKCNFSRFDETPDVAESGRFNFEKIFCPMRGECRSEGIICGAKYNSQFTKREIEVLKLKVLAFRNYEIADRLFISKLTVDNHLRNMEHKANVHSLAELIEWSRKHNIINS